MVANEALRWGLTVLVLTAFLYAAFRAGRTSPPAARIGFALHAAMMAAMVPMLVPGPRWPALPQILLFGLAAWWFVLRSVARRPRTVAGQPRIDRERLAGRGTLLYHALTMAAMAYMLAAMETHGTASGGAGTAGLAGQAVHHGGTAVGLMLPDSQPAFVLAVAFGLAGAAWGVRMLRHLATEGRPRTGEGFLELAGAASMAAMFAALAAG